MSQKRQLAKINVLKKLIKEEANCVSLVPTTRLLAVPPLFLNDLKSGIIHILNNSLKKYDRGLDGILIGYQNIRVLLDENTGIIQIGTAETEVNVSVEFYIFQPKIGSCLKGIVNKKSNNHIGCLVHGYFNATILKPEDVDYEDWICKNFNVNDKIIFTVKDLDFSGVLPYIEGTVSEEMLDKVELGEGNEGNTEIDVALGSVFKKQKKKVKDKSKKDKSKSVVNNDEALMEKAEVNMNDNEEDLTNFVNNLIKNMEDSDSTSPSTVKKKKKKKDKDKDKDKGKSKINSTDVAENVPTDSVYFKEDEVELENTLREIIQSSLDESDSVVSKKKTKKKLKNKESVTTDSNTEANNTVTQTKLSDFINTSKLLNTNKEDSVSENSTKKNKKVNVHKTETSSFVSTPKLLNTNEGDSVSENGSKKKKVKEGDIKKADSVHTHVEQHEGINLEETISRLVQSSLGESDLVSTESKSMKKKKKEHKKSSKGTEKSEESDISNIENTISKLIQSSLKETLGSSQQEVSEVKKIKGKSLKEGESKSPAGKHNELSKKENNNLENTSKKSEKSEESNLNLNKKENKKKKNIEDVNESTNSIPSISEQPESLRLGSTISNLIQSSLDENDSIHKKLKKTKKEKELENTIKMGHKDVSVSEKGIVLTNGVNEMGSSFDNSVQSVTNKKEKKKKKENDLKVGKIKDSAVETNVNTELESHTEDIIKTLIKSTIEREFENEKIKTNKNLSNSDLVSEKKNKTKKKREKEDVLKTMESIEKETTTSPLTVNNVKNIQSETTLDKIDGHSSNLHKNKSKKSKEDSSHIEKLNVAKETFPKSPTKTPSVHKLKNHKETKNPEKKSEKSKEISFQLEEANNVNELSNQEEEVDSIFYSTQIEPSKEQKKMDTPFCSPILPESIKKEKKSKKDKQKNLSLLESIMKSSLPEHWDKKEEASDDGKQKRDKKRKRGEDEESEISPISKKIKNTILSPTTPKKETKESKNLSNSLNSSLGKTGERKSESDKAEVTENVVSFSNDVHKNPVNTANSEISKKSEKKIIVNKNKNVNKKKEPAQDVQVESLYEKLLKEAKNAINSNAETQNEISSDLIHLSTETKKTSTSSNGTTAKAKNKKDKTEELSTGSKVDNLEEERQKPGKKRKREESNEPEVSAKKLKNGSMYDTNYSPQKLIEDSSLFSDSDRSFAKSPEKKIKKINGVVSDSTLKETSEIGSETTKREKINKTEKSMEKKEKRKERKSSSGKDSKKQAEDDSAKSSLYEKLLIEAKNLFESPKTETPSAKKKEKTDLKQKTIKDYLNNLSKN